MRSRENLAWAAGLFEGEGTFACSTDVNRWSNRAFRAAVAMTDFDVVEKLHAVLGFGALAAKPTYKPNHKPQLMWYATRFEHFQAVIAMLWPWLGTRRKQRAKELLLMAREYHSVRSGRRGCPNRSK